MSSATIIAKLCSAAAITVALFATTATGAVAKPAKEIVVKRQIDPNVRTARVSHRDLNLTLASDQRRLNGRVGRAVEYVCDPIEVVGFSQDYRMCKTGAWASARPQINLAIQRSYEIAATGSSTIPPVAIVLAFPSR